MSSLVQVASSFGVGVAGSGDCVDGRRVGCGVGGGDVDSNVDLVKPEYRIVAIIKVLIIEGGMKILFDMLVYIANCKSVVMEMIV